MSLLTVGSGLKVLINGRFFAEFDSDRTALLPVYAQHATLSHNMSSIAPRRRTKETSVVASRASFDTWGDQNRNLIRIGKNRRTQTLIVSDAQSLREWLVKGIPATKHPLDDPTRWMYDVLPLDAVAGVGRIMLTIHGEFYECEFRGPFARSGTDAFCSGKADVSCVLTEYDSQRSTAGYTVSRFIRQAQHGTHTSDPEPPAPDGLVSSCPTHSRFDHFATLSTFPNPWPSPALRSYRDTLHLPRLAFRPI